MFILDTTKDSVYRGGGRIMQVLRENLSEATFISSLTNFDQLRPASTNSTLLIPSWNPFSPPILTKRIAKKQFIMIFDVIPLKYPAYFPAGIRGNINLWRNKQALSIYDKIITISEHSKKDIVQYLKIPAEKIDVVYPAVSKVFLDSEIQNSEFRIQNNSKLSILNSNFCMYVGDVNWNKNLVNLARAIKIADVTCIFVGKPFSHETWNASSFMLQASWKHPWLKSFREFLEIINQDKRFIFLGYVKDEELINLYQHAVCNTMVSFDEGFGYSYAEAGSQGCPSVLSDTPIFHEAAGDTALFANPKNPEEIAKQINVFFTDNRLRNAFAQEAKERALEKYSPEQFAKACYGP